MHKKDKFQKEFLEREGAIKEALAKKKKIGERR
jgi:hypothetical protein